MTICFRWAPPAVPLSLRTPTFVNFHFDSNCPPEGTLSAWRIILELNVPPVRSGFCVICPNSSLSWNGRWRRSFHPKSMNFQIHLPLTPPHPDRINWEMNLLVLRFWFWNLGILQGQPCLHVAGSPPKGVDISCTVCSSLSWRWRPWFSLDDLDLGCGRSSWCTWPCKWSSSYCFRWVWGMPKWWE